MAGPKIDSRLRAQFREQARETIARDRSARKFGHSQNTIGEIERALVKAYLLGYETARRPTAVSAESRDSDIVDWIEIPPRARDALWYLSRCLNCGMEQISDTRIMAKRIMLKGQNRWVSVDDRDKKDPHTFSYGGISPLIKLGLLEMIDGNDALLGITARGLTTCREYWRRWEEQDPTLPLMSIRPA
jgi:hypothetical protein